MRRRRRERGVKERGEKGGREERRGGKEKGERERKK